MGRGLQQWSQLGERATGKWQIPAFLFATIALFLSLVSYRSPLSKLPFNEMREELSRLVEQGMYTAAIESGNVLLQVPEKDAQDLGAVHAGLARARLLRAERNGATVSSIGRAVVEHYQAAVAGGFELGAEDHVRLGKAYEWTGDFESAVQWYESSLELLDEPSLDLRWRVVKLHADKVAVDPGRFNEELDGLIADATDRPDILVWVVERKAELLCEANRYLEASGLVEELGPLLEAEPWVGWLEYLRSYVLYRSGEWDQAETRLRMLLGGLALRDKLYVQSAWLLGRAVLSDDGPQRPMEAITFFEEAVLSSASPIHAAASELGVAEALVMVERFDEALVHYQGAISKLLRLPANRVVNLGAVELSLTVAGEGLLRSGRVDMALRFAEEAARLGAEGEVERYTHLLERVAELKSALARKKRAQAEELTRGDVGGDGRPGDPAGEAAWGAGDLKSEDPARAGSLLAESRILLLESGALYNQIASLNTMDEERSEEAAWRSAERIHESGDHGACAASMKAYIQSRAGSPLVPRALRLLGHAQQALGLYEDAVETYQENQRRFPRTPDAGSSLIPLARCYMALGKKYADLAEATLRIILDDSEVFTPSATEYADALFLLGELLNRSGSYEHAIPILEEAMERYPGDGRMARAQFLLGDCYLQSGLAMKEDMDSARFAGERERLGLERNKRLGRAADLFGRMVEEYEARDVEGLTRLDEVYLRNARLYRADCHFELGEYDQSVAQYERAAWIYKGTTTALAAYVQIINCHTFTGNPAEASAALRRAQYLVNTMQDEAFAGQAEMETREDWRRYFAWVERSELF